MTKLQLALEQNSDAHTRFILWSVGVDGDALGLLPDAPGKERASARRWVLERAEGLEICNPITPALRFEIVTSLYDKTGWVSRHWQGIQDPNPHPKHETKCPGCGDSEKLWTVGSIAEVVTSWVFFHGVRCACMEFCDTMGAIAKTQSPRVRLETAALLAACQTVSTRAVTAEMAIARSVPLHKVEYDDGMAILLSDASKFRYIRSNGIGNDVNHKDGFARVVEGALARKTLEIPAAWFNETHVLPRGVAAIVIGYLG